MRILLISHYGIPHTGGIEVVVDALARRFARAGHDVTHLCSAAVRPDDAIEAGDEQWPYRRVRLAAANVLERRFNVPYPLFSPLLPLPLWKEVGKSDVVHAHGALYQDSFLGALIASLQNKPLIVTEHVGEVPYRNRIARSLQRFAFASIGRATLRRADRLIVLNERVEREMRRLHRTAKIVKSWNGVDSDRFRPPVDDTERRALRERLGWADSRRRLLLVGRMVEKKGIDIAISAARELGNSYELILVGPGSVASALPTNVTLAGAKSPDRVAEMYRAADALLLPSRGEGFPLAVQEALCSGLPVFVPRDPEFTTLLTDAGRAAQFVDLEPQQIADSIRAYYSEPVALHDLQKDAASFARERFGWDRVVAQHLDLYQETLAERGVTR